MYVVLVILRKIVVKYGFYVIYVDSASRHIGSNQNIGSAVAEAVHNAVTLNLLQITVQTFREIATSLKCLYQFVHTLLRITEHNGKLWCVHI